MKCAPFALVHVIFFHSIHKIGYSFLFLILLLIPVSCKQNVKLRPEQTVVKGEIGLRLAETIVPYIENLRTLTDNQAGLAIGVTEGTETIFTHYFGFANVQDRVEIDRKSIFHIASVSKPFVAFAVMQMVEQGKLSLDYRLIDLIPEFEMAGDGYDNIKIKHILTHTSGIPANLSADDWTNPVYGDHALEENLKAAKIHKLLFEPGSQYSYSNSAYDLLGLALSRVSKQPFAEFMDSQIFKPAGMNSTQYIKDGKQLKTQLANAYSYGLETQEWQPFPYNEKLFPSSGILSNLEDLLVWTKIHSGKGTYNGVTLLGETYFDLLTAEQYDTPWNEKIGLSWFIQSYLDQPVIMHQGQDTGFESLVYIYPKEDISIVVIANRDFSRTGRIINAISEVIFETEPKAYEVSAKYKFAEAYKKEGIEKAITRWSELKRDTTDIYYVDDEDILTTGAILENGGKWEEVREVLEFYKKLNDRSTYAWRLLGNAYLNLGDTTTAIQHYEQCLVLNPGYEKAKLAMENLQM